MTMQAYLRTQEVPSAGLDARETRGARQQTLRDARQRRVSQLLQQIQEPTGFLPILHIPN